MAECLMLLMNPIPLKMRRYTASRDGDDGAIMYPGGKWVSALEHFH